MQNVSTHQLDTYDSLNYFGQMIYTPQISSYLNFNLPKNFV